MLVIIIGKKERSHLMNKSVFAGLLAFSLAMTMAAPGFAATPATQSKAPATPAKASATTQNLVINGSFEEGKGTSSYNPLSPGSKDLKGWNVTRAQIDYLNGYFPASNGKRSLDMDGTPGIGGVSQTISTIPGQKYTVTFDLSGNNQGGDKMKKLGVKAGEKTTAFTYDTKMGQKWVRKNWEFTASAPKTTLEFYSMDADKTSSYGPLLDNVSVMKAPTKGTH
jgi:choice-of-anchor C domain-containing protein